MEQQTEKCGVCNGTGESPNISGFRCKACKGSGNRPNRSERIAANMAPISNINASVVTVSNPKTQETAMKKPAAKPATNPATPTPATAKKGLRDSLADLKADTGLLQGRKPATPRKPGEAPKRRAWLKAGQVRILNVLQDGPLPKQRIELFAEINPVWTYDMVGRPDAEARHHSERTPSILFPSLITLGLVEAEELEDQGRVSYRFAITDLGRKALQHIEANGNNRPEWAEEWTVAWPVGKIGTEVAGK